MAKNRIGSCSKCNSDLFNENKPFNTNYWALNNEKDGSTKFFCDNCWENGEEGRFLNLVSSSWSSSVEGECEHCEGVWEKGQKIGDYTATKNHHINHEHNRFGYKSEPCDLCNKNQQRDENSPHEPSPRTPSSPPKPSDSPSNPSSPSKLKNPLVIGGIIVGSLVLIGLIFYFINRNKHHE